MTTYSSNLRLSMIGSGAEAGTWGNTTNYNLGTLMEEAVAGYSPVSVAVADYALTANNGVEDESRMAMLRINTSVISATFRVYAPPVSKSYVIWNTSAYDMWIYNSTVIGNTTGAGLYAVIKAGDKSLVFSDATNFYTVTNASAASGTVSSVNVSGGTTGLTFSGGPITTSGTITAAGTLAVANGGTGVTTSTGSGSAVLSASPALTGTPTAPTATGGTNTTQIATTAFVLANTVNSFSGGATGLTPAVATTGAVSLAGTLAVANGGTGVTTSTGSGSAVLSASPAFTGVPTAPTAAAGTNTTQIATTAFVQSNTTAAVTAAYPVGSIYMNASNATNPGTLLGFGTWSSLGAGRMLVGFSSGDPLFGTVGNTGGSRDAFLVTHTHYVSITSTSAGSHYHGIGNNNGNNGGSFGYGSWSGYHYSGSNSWLWNGSGGGIGYGGDQTSGNMASTFSINGAGGDTHSHDVNGYAGNTGSGSGANANLPPYLVVYMWQRTA